MIDREKYIAEAIESFEKQSKPTIEAIRIQEEIEQISKEYKIPYEKLIDLINKVLKNIKENK